MAYVFCNQCGHRNPVDSVFCSSCGALLDRPADQTITLAKVDPLQDAPGPADDTVVQLGDLPAGVASLVVRSGAQAGATFALRGSITRLGRHPDSEIILDDITVSRRHADIVRDDDAYLVRDAGSLNGTYVNAERVDEATLHQGDELQVGKFRLVFFELGSAEVVTSGINERPYLSIGEVLGLLLEEFPDVTISKIRFLESQGLIEPERTSSGYRKFFDADIERLRVILREQRENFLPLRVIRDRLETGEIDDSGAIVVPPTEPADASAAAPRATVSQLHRGIRNVRVNESAAESAASSNHPVLDDTRVDDSGLDDTGGTDVDDPTGSMHPDASSVVTNRHPAAQSRQLAAVRDDLPDPTPTGMLLRADVPVEVYSRAELCDAGGVTTEQLEQLESYGLVAARGTGVNATYSASDVTIVTAAAGFLARGIDARHLRGWRQSAEREVGLFEQRIMPLLRQRNPQARHDAVQLVGELADLGAELRQALIVSMLRPHLDA